MADSSDVESALVALADAALYPAGDAGPSAVGAVCRVYRGWPEPGGLQADLDAGIVNVSVFAVEGGQRNTTRFLDDGWEMLGAVAPGLSVATSGQRLVFGGDAAAGQLAGVLADARSYVYATQAGDTPAMVAANLASLIRADRIATLHGATVIVPGTARLVGRVVAEQPALRQTRRQEQAFRLSCWCPDPATRDMVAARIDAVLSDIRFVALADGSRGQLRFQRGVAVDQGSPVSLFRRDLIYAVEYPTTVSALLPTMLFADLTTGAGGQIAAALLA